MTDSVSQHFVEFFSPGTFFAETSIKPIHEWDVQAALEMAKGIKERYNATPYGFRFLTRVRGPDDLDSKIVARSPMHFIGGRIRTLAEVEAEANPSERTLLSNMRINDWDRVITSTSGWRWTQPLGPDDVVLETI